MGLFDLLKREKKQVPITRAALDEALDPNTDDGGAVTRLIQQLLSVGIDGRGPFISAEKYAEKALKKHGDTDKAINAISRNHVIGGAGGGFATSLGGFITMPVAIPVNVFEFYLQATRLVAATAHLRGYDLSRPEIRTAVLLTLIGTDANDVLAKAGVVTSGVVTGTIGRFAMERLPRAALMVVNKAIGFQMLKSVGAKTLTRFGRMVPVVGGAVGGAVDGWLMKRIGDNARVQFPEVVTVKG